MELPDRMATGCFVVSDRPLGLGHRGDLILEHIRAQPAGDGGLVGLEDIVTQMQSGVQKCLVVLAGRVEVLNQGKQSGSVQAGKTGLDITPCWACFLRGHWGVRGLAASLAMTCDGANNCPSNRCDLKNGSISRLSSHRRTQLNVRGVNAILAISQYPESCWRRKLFN